MEKKTNATSKNAINKINEEKPYKKTIIIIKITLTV